MSGPASVQAEVASKPAITPAKGGVLQRQCACGQHTSGGECGECAKKQRESRRSPSGRQPLQAKLTIGDSRDALEQEAERVAYQVLAARSDAGTRSTYPQIQRYSGVPAGYVETAPASVERVLSTPGVPLEAGVQQDMGQRFGRDFSEVRVHTGPGAHQSARDVHACAYTSGRDIVFAAGQYAPATPAGRRLIAHELTHVIQQTGAGQPGVRQVRGRESKRASGYPAGQQSDAGKGEPRAETGVIRRLIQRQTDDEGGQAPPMTRPEEIALSRSSPGEVTGEPDPLTMSLYNFGIDVAQPKPEHEAALQELGRFLGANATVPVVVRVLGFADSTGNERYNLGLSRRRSEAVKRILDPLITQRIIVSAYGETNPAASNETVSGRSRNRRVDLRFFVNAPSVPRRPRPRPVPPGPRPPQPQPPTPPQDHEPDESFCSRHPILCGIGITPFLLPLVCLVAPEMCLAVTCALAPELCIIPPPPPPPGPPEPPEQPERPEDGHPVVQFIPTVRSPTTPVGVKDRIGMNDPISITAVVTTTRPLTQPIIIDVDGSGSGAGTATVNGQAQMPITGTTAFSLAGTRPSDVTFPWNPHLELAAWWSGQLVGTSNRFAVSALAENWSLTFDGPQSGPHGVIFWAKMNWQPDSGSYRDLSECYYVELVSVERETGGMKGLGTGGTNDPNNPDPADLAPTWDQHGTPFEYIRAPGYSRLKQLFRIWDRRSNSGWAASRNSGFIIERTAERDPKNPRCWRLVVRKRGGRVSIGGMQADAGSGDESHEFTKLNCEPAPPEPPGPGPQPPVRPPAPPAPGPQVEPSTCDQAEMARRVDACVADAEEEAKECVLALIPFSGGWGGVGEGVGFLVCLEDVKRRLLECDRRAKEDTHCTGSGQDSRPRIAGSEGTICPSCHALQRRWEARRALGGPRDIWASIGAPDEEFSSMERAPGIRALTADQLRLIRQWAESGGS